MQFPVIRQLTDPDRRHLRPHFKVLDATDRRLRFGAALDDAAIDRYVDLIDFDTDAVLSVADASGRLIAVAHVAPGGEWVCRSTRSRAAPGWVAPCSHRRWHGHAIVI